MNTYLILGVIIFLTAMIAEIYILYYLAYFFIILSISIKLYNYNLQKNLVLRHYLKDNHIFYKEKTNVKIEITNKGKLPILWLKLKEGLPVKLTTVEQEMVINLKAGESYCREFEIRGKRRGFYTIGPLNWETGDIFGFEKIKGVLREETLFVFPEILSLEELNLPSRIPYGNINWPQPIFKDPVKMAGVRDYQHGDSLNKIHWKASARSSELKSRKTEAAVTLETAIVLDLARSSYGLKGLEPMTELAVTTAASIAAYLTRHRQVFKFISNGRDPLYSGDDILHYSGISEEGRLQELLEILARIEVSRRGSLDLIKNSEFNLSWGATIIIITKMDSKKIMDWCLELLQRGFSVKLLLVGNELKHKEYEHLSFTAPLTIYQLKDKGDIYGV